VYKNYRRTAGTIVWCFNEHGRQRALTFQRKAGIRKKIILSDVFIIKQLKKCIRIDNTGIKDRFKAHFATRHLWPRRIEQMVTQSKNTAVQFNNPVAVIGVVPKLIRRTDEQVKTVEPMAFFSNL